VSEVRRVGRDLGGDDDLPVVDRELGVVALHPGLALGADHARVVVADIHQPGRQLGHDERLHDPGRHSA
jgi:hypothetical protein